jgi:hypothetical protein
MALRTRIRKMNQDSGIKAFATLGLALAVMVSGALVAAWLAGAAFAG